MTKKHKKERKRKRHHSYSSSESTDEKEKKRHHKKKHKKDKKHCKKKKESSSSPPSVDEIIELDTPSPPPAPSISEDGPKTPPPPPSRKRAHSPKAWASPPMARMSSPPPKLVSPATPEPTRSKPRAKSPESSPPPLTTSRDSLSIEETNALRIKLGMKPLQVDPKIVVSAPSTSQSSVQNGSSSTPDVILIEGEEGQFVHKPAESLTNKRETEKLRARLAERKEKREIEGKYKKIKTLGEDSDDETASSWVKKSRKIEVEKEKAAKRAQELDEMDKLFGVSELIEDEMKKEKKDAYSSKNLKGLTVEHDIESFEEGKNVILTLKDHGVLDEDNGDSLVNVNMLDDERYKKSNFNKKQKPFGSDLYDDDDEEMEFGEKSILKKYDEEIKGEKKSSFTIGENRSVITKDRVKEKLRANMKLESLETRMEVATDYYTTTEMEKFKKPKKMKKIRKKPLKADDLLKMRIQELFPSGNNDLGSRKPAVKPEIDELDVDDTPALPLDMEEVPFKVEVKEEETELSHALKKARKLKQLKDKPLPSYLEIGEKIKTEIKEEPMDEDEAANSIVLNSTAEFCRTLGDIPTYGLAGNREEADQLTDQLDFDKDMRRDSLRRDDENEGGWQDAEMDNRVVDITNVEAEPILDAEPDLGSGVAGALRMAVSKGYLEKETVNRPNAARFTHLQAQNYSIEDKSHGEDDKFGSRRDRYMGPTLDFKEKDTYKPNIKLEYIDDDGRILSAKEAFRYLSHKFHGKGPGKNKIEKRMKKNEQEVLMKQMSSSDTPLGTLQMLQSKQAETQSPFVVLSGSKHQLSASTSISKSKFK